MKLQTQAFFFFSLSLFFLLRNIEDYYHITCVHITRRPTMMRKRNEYRILNKNGNLQIHTIYNRTPSKINNNNNKSKYYKRKFDPLYMVTFLYPYFWFGLCALHTEHVQSHKIREHSHRFPQIICIGPQFSSNRHSGTDIGV